MNMDTHRHLDDELNSLRDRVLLLGGEAEAALDRAMHALTERDSELARQALVQQPVDTLPQDGVEAGEHVAAEDHVERVERAVGGQVMLREVDAVAEGRDHGDDLVAHLGSGTPWLGFAVGRPVRILVIENEGPRVKFREKLARKLATWQDASWEMNVDVPGRLSLVGYDNTYLARLRSIWLTSVDSVGFDAGRLAARTLLARVADPARPAELHLLPPALEVRGSTAPPPS